MFPFRLPDDPWLGESTPLKESEGLLGWVWQSISLPADVVSNSLVSKSAS